MTKKFKVNLTKSAQTDLERIYDYIAADSPANAFKFVLQLEQRVYSLNTFPERNPVYI